LGVRDSELFDAAIAALLANLDREAELSAMKLHPYDADPELMMPGAPGTADDFDQRLVPEYIRALAESKRNQSPGILATSVYR
jgi:hypothetical protein